MFQRRVKLSRLQMLRELFWPKMGWIRAFKYVYHRVIRLSDSSHSIGRGLATGASISFTPLIGTHFIQAGLIAWLVRGNLLASLVGTFVGNPWTFPFMWFAAYSFGVQIFSLFGFDDFGDLPDELNVSMLWDLVTEAPMQIFLPWLVGGYLLALLLWPLFFLLFYYLVGLAKRARALARNKRLKYKTRYDFYKAEHKKR